MNQNVTLNYNYIPFNCFEDAFVLVQEAEEKRKRLEEAEKKRQAMMQAQKEKQQAGGPGKGGQKKTDGGVSHHFKLFKFQIFRKREFSQF